MGYYLDPALTKRRCDSYRSHLEKDNQSITTVRNAVNSFLDEGILKSVSISGIKEHMLDYKAVLDALEYANDADISDCESLKSIVSATSKILDSNEIDHGKEESKKNKEEADAKAEDYLNRSLGFSFEAILLGNYYRNMYSYYTIKSYWHQKEYDHWEKEERTYYEIESGSESLFSKGMAIRGSAQKGLNVISCSFSGDGFHSDGESWRMGIVSVDTELAAVYLFKKNIKEQFGFDDRTCEIMLKVYAKLKENNPNAPQSELDWLFVRLMGGLYYDDDPQKILIISIDSKTFWDDVSGIAFDGKTEEEYYVDILGIGKEEYGWLRYKVRVQHVIAGAPDNYWLPSSVDEIKDSGRYGDFQRWKKTFDKQTRHQYKSVDGTETEEEKVKKEEEEFLRIWNNQYGDFLDKGDFAHQQITTSAIMASEPSFHRDGIGSNIFLHTDDEGVADYAGWLGDATLMPPPSFGGDDYISDLDAENITSRMKNKKISYFEAVNYYYDELANGSSRATLFLKDTGLDVVKKKIYAELVYPELYRQINVASSTRDLEEIKRLSGLLQDDNYAMECLKREAPDTFRFIKNLEAESPTLEDIK